MADYPKGMEKMDHNEPKCGVFIIGKTDCGEAVCAASGRISTQQGTAIEIFERSRDAEKNASLIGKVTASGHTSTVEHMCFNLAFENVSVAVEQFMIEFRLASFTVKSRRYVDFGGSGYNTPDFGDDSVTEKYCSHMDSLFAEYNSLIESGIEKEDARFLLPYCFRSNFYCTLNARELLLVLRRMMWGRESENEEIRALGLQLYEQAADAAPGIFGSIGTVKTPAPDEPIIDFSCSDAYDLSCDEPETPDRPKVELLAATPDAEKCVALSYLIGTGKYAPFAEEIAKDADNVKRIIDAVCTSSRPRSLESAVFTFRLNNVSLACVTHFARHRMQSIIVPPLTTANRRRFITPPVIDGNERLLARYNQAFESTAQLYDELKSMGYDEHKLTGCLLAGNTVDIVTTMNARELLLFFKLRSCTRAQWEIREYATEMLKSLKAMYPILFSVFGPSCSVDGFCPEGRLSCGRIAEMKQLFRQ